MTVILSAISFLVVPEAALASQDQIVARDPSTVVLPESLIEGLVPYQVSMMKETVANVEVGFAVAGKALRSMAQELRMLRENLPKRTWTKFTESGVLPIPGKTARELESSWDFINQMGLSNGDLVHLSSRTLSKIKNANPDAQAELIKRAKSGTRITESMVKDLNAAVDESDLTAAQKQKVKANVNAATKLKAKEDEIEALKEQIAKLKKQNAELTKKLNIKIDSIAKSVTSSVKEGLEA
jgi:cell division protein FtsB